MWTYSGSPDDDRQRMISSISDAVDEDDEESIVQGIAGMKAALNAGDDALFEDAGAAFFRSCEANGWEPPEG